MDKETNFLIFCIEEYRNKKELSGKQVVALFQQYDVFTYILSCYEALHTTGVNYLVEDIDQLIAERSRG